MVHAEEKWDGVSFFPCQINHAMDGRFKSVVGPGIEKILIFDAQ
jgi:hypothetical protein